MPSAETLDSVRANVKTAEAGLLLAREESRKLRAAGLTAHADAIDADIKVTSERVAQLKRAYNL